MSDDELIYSEEEREPQPPIYLDSRAGRCLTEVLNDMFMEGSLSLPQLEDIPMRFNDCMNRVISQRIDIKVKIEAQLKEFRDVPTGATWHCNRGRAILPGLEMSASSFEVKGSF